MSATNEFVVTYANGAKVKMFSTCDSVEQFCNEHFGSTWNEAQEHGALVFMIPDANTPSIDPPDDSGAGMVETVEYADGSSATGPAPLPLQSPAEQDAARSSAE